MGFYRGPRIVTDGLVMYLDAANPKSYPGIGVVWNDLSKNGNNGTLINGPTFDSGNGGSIVFDGMNDYVNLNNSLANSIKNTSTVSVWLYRTTIFNTSNGFSQAFFNVYKNDSNRGLIYFSADVGYGGRIGSLLVDNGTITGRVYTQQNIWNVGWYNIVATRESLNYKIYVNGVDMPLTVVANNANKSYHEDPTQTILGAAFFSSLNHYAFIPAYIQQVSIYDKVLNSQEILQNYNATKSRFGL